MLNVGIFLWQCKWLTHTRNSLKWALYNWSLDKWDSDMKGLPVPIIYSELCELTSIRKEDVVSTLQNMNLVQYYKGQYVICLSEEVLERHARSMKKRKIRIDPKCIKWTPKDWSKRGKW